MSISMVEIGKVKRDQDRVEIHIHDEFKAALEGLTLFSHIQVLWWAHDKSIDSIRKNLTVKPPYAPDTRLGIFATRSQARPNSVCSTACPIEEVDFEKGIIKVANIDAYDQTPVLDIKGYYPIFDRVNNAKVPDWGFGMPEGVPETGVEIWE